LAVFKPRADFYAAARPTLDDILLVVEISDTTFRVDRNIKVPRFAASGIPEVWIEDLKKNVFLVFRDPLRDRYETILTLRVGDFVSPLAFPDITFAVRELLGD
jgi:Uma2 family endonuclease